MFDGTLNTYLTNEQRNCAYSLGYPARLLSLLIWYIIKKNSEKIRDIQKRDHFHIA